MRDQRSSCLGRKSTTPVGPSEVERERGLSRYQDTSVSSKGIQSTAANVVPIRLEHCRKETHRLGQEPCFTEASLELCPRVDRLWSSVLWIGFHLAERLEVVRLVIAEQQTGGFEPYHSG